jgi:hypothetical protein
MCSQIFLSIFVNYRNELLFAPLEAGFRTKVWRIQPPEPEVEFHLVYRMVMNMP